MFNHARFPQPVFLVVPLTAQKVSKEIQEYSIVMSVNSIGRGFSALFCSQLHPCFPYIRKTALIFGVHVLSICCQKLIVARQALQTNRQEAVEIVVVVPRLQY